MKRYIIYKKNVQKYKYNSDVLRTMYHLIIFFSKIGFNQRGQPDKGVLWYKARILLSIDECTSLQTAMP